MAKDEVARGRPGAKAGATRGPRAIQAALGPRKEPRNAPPRRSGNARRRCPDTHDRRARAHPAWEVPRDAEGEREDGMRRTIPVVVALLMALALAACGGGSGGNATGSRSSETGG